MSGHLPAHTFLPSERELAERFEVNRQVIREATKRLTHLGLLKPGQGQGTRVLDWRRTGSFDLVAVLVARASGTGHMDLTLAVALLEIRLMFGLATVQLCITNATDDQLDELRGIAEDYRLASDVLARSASAWAFWGGIVDCTNNIAFRLMFNSLAGAGGPAMLLMAQASTNIPGEPGDLLAVADALLSRNSVEAERAARHLLRIEPTPALVAAGLGPASGRAATGGAEERNDEAGIARSRA
jgi:DNA-binding FadR family transcriptional regulator